MNCIREVRNSKGIRQNWLALNIGMKQARLSRYENSIRRPPDDVLQRIAAALGVEVGDIWDDEPYSIQGDDTA